MQQRLRAAGTHAWRARLTVIAVSSVLASAGAHAFEIDTGNSDLGVRWDNTVRYNVGKRVQNQDPAILANPNLDDGDRNFSKGSLVTNRLDILSELDVVFRRQLGFRVSGAGWYDDAYRNLDNTNTATANTLVNGLPVAGELSPYTKRYAKGASGEILDAFVFGNFDIAGIPVNVKAGQHTVYWGDSFLLGGAIHGVNYGQNPLDIWKGFATPGSEAKELFRPRGGVTVQAQPLNDLSVAGQWFYQWQPVRIPESGSYLTIQDAINLGGQSFITGPNPFAASVPGSPALLRLWRGTDIEPKSTSASLGEFGLSSRWSPAWLDGTLGFYARKTSDNVPQLMATQGVVPGVPAATCGAIGGTPLPGNLCLANKNVTSVADLQKYGKLGTYNTAYGDDIRIYGITLSKSIAGMSIGAELSERRNMPLQSDAVAVLPAALVPLVPGSVATNNLPTHGTPGALGTTYHGLVNVFNVIPKTPLFDTATVVAEVTWMQWAKVTQNAAVFKGRDSYTAIDKVTKNYAGLAINFTPTWFQVLPGVDLLAPVTWSQGLYGNAAIAFGGNKNTGNWSAGIGADILQRYRVDLKYNGYYGQYSTNPAGALLVANGASASLSDRGWVSLTFKTTF
ncbi:MAG TPA: DUF1302 domain-containing protein [Usitatibacter sp.]|jgi:hypothetical protein|nr:DUF1302 domain-containing protein [Usitatibacter sp.]